MPQCLINKKCNFNAISKNKYIYFFIIASLESARKSATDSNYQTTDEDWDVAKGSMPCTIGITVKKKKVTIMYIDYVKLRVRIKTACFIIFDTETQF